MAKNKTGNVLARMKRDIIPGHSSRQVVAGLYRGILGREPDRAGLAHYRSAIRAGMSIAGLARALLGSKEFAARSAALGGAAGHVRGFAMAPPLEIDGSFSPEEADRYWRHVASVWSSFGETDPYWSVLTNQRYRTEELTDETLAAFYQTGRHSVDRLMAGLARGGIAIRPDDVCAEYGCGVGRVTLWLARRFKRVIAFDVSAPHIDVARRYLAAQGLDNVEFVLVRGGDDLRKLSDANCFYSVIVLQHNPPPIISGILQAAFELMGKDSTFFFQLPTYMMGYRFRTNDYLATLGDKATMEMHCLPQPMIYDLAASAGVRPVEILPDPATGNEKAWLSSTFLMRKS